MFKTRLLWRANVRLFEAFLDFGVRYLLVADKKARHAVPQLAWRGSAKAAAANRNAEIKAHGTQVALSPSASDTGNSCRREAGSL
jgi:hypothetical protein